MIGLDTNVLVRYIMQDDARQSPKATRLIESLTSSEPGFVTLVSVVELVWVLSASYDLTRDEVTRALDGLLKAKELITEQNEQVSRALRLYRAGKADFADCLIERTASNAGCSRVMTFDAGASKSAGMTLIH